jgi:elongation factor P
MDTSDIRKNLKIMLDGQPYIVVDFQFVKPGKGQAFTRCKLRNMETGNMLERTFRSGDKLEAAEVEVQTLQYIYPEGDAFVFMNQQTGDQIHIPGDRMRDEAKWLYDGMSIEVTLLKGNPIGIEIPPHVELQIVESEPGVKGDTSGGAQKPAKVSTGTVVSVPLFVQVGEWVKIDTRTGQYLERVKPPQR